MGKYGPWYWIHPWLLCRDRSAAARRCACFFSFFSTKMIEIKIHFEHNVGKWYWYWIGPWILCRDRSAAARCCACIYSHFKHLKLDCFVKIWPICQLRLIVFEQLFSVVPMLYLDCCSSRKTPYIRWDNFLSISFKV